MSKVMTTVPVSDLRTRQASIIAQLEESPILLTQRGRGASVLVHPDQWNEIVEQLEHYEDMIIPVRPVKRARGFLKGMETLVERESDRV